MVIDDDGYINTNGEQLDGMSGSPVFNGWGLAAIATHMLFNKQKVEETLVYYKVGAKIIPIQNLIEILNHESAVNFAVSINSSSIIQIPRKSYCSQV